MFNDEPGDIGLVVVSQKRSQIVGKASCRLSWSEKEAFLQRKTLVEAEWIDRPHRQWPIGSQELQGRRSLYLAFDWPHGQGRGRLLGLLARHPGRISAPLGIEHPNRQIGRRGS